MSLPEPVPGLVIRYRYLWHDEADIGRDEGQKDRPCAVVLAVTNRRGRQHVVVAPITHSKPNKDPLAVHLDWSIKRRLGLDDEPSWIITNDVNVFEWPGHDLDRIQTGSGEKCDYGNLPASITRRLINTVRTHSKDKSLKQVQRD
jgi:PemK-like, MazF-like toxin of type II toxin-antitoxin system